MDINTILLISIAIVLVMLLILFLNSKNNGLTPQLLDLKNQINELNLKQAEAQKEVLTLQQTLLTGSQEQINKQLTAILSSMTDHLSKTQGNINTQLAEILSTVNHHLSAAQSNINNQLAQATTLMGTVKEKLGVLETTARNMEEIGKDISSLQELLLPPKIRGNIGELMLEELLKQILPQGCYQFQYSFRNNCKVDAVIRIGRNLIPVDSKFPLDSFRQMMNVQNENELNALRKDFIGKVKKKIDEIAEKYINEDEGTFNFALMYIPAENVYYETIIQYGIQDGKQDLFNYAIQKHVIPVSPSSFYAYLTAIVYGLKGMTIEKHARQIIDELSRVQQDFSAFYNDYSVLGKHLNNALNKYNETHQKADRLNDRMNRITHNRMDLIGQETPEEITGA